MNTGYQHVEPQLGNFIHGDGKLGTSVLNTTGQWDNYLPTQVTQNSNGFEPNDCVSVATETCVKILEKFLYVQPTDWSIRFLASISGTGEKGGNDPQTVSETLRKKGMCYEHEYPYQAPDLQTFYQPVPKKVQLLATGEFAEYSYGHSWVNNNPDSMKQALTYSPLSSAGYAWQQDPVTGYYISPKGSIPEHDFTVYGYEEGKYWKVLDSYAPYIKRLAWDYNFTGTKRHTLQRQITPQAIQTGLWQQFINLLQAIAKTLYGFTK